jgi:phosphatidylserine/phosphatidylglycerophosphate/cardiolipin synthase-like enzyme
LIIFAVWGKNTPMKKIVTLFSVFILLMVLFPPMTFPQEKPVSWEVYFSPKGGCTDAIVRELNKAKTTILIQAYSFTSTPIAKALLGAHKRGVKVEVILDKSQRNDKYSSADRCSSYHSPQQSHGD